MRRRVARHHHTWRMTRCRSRTAGSLPSSATRTHASKRSSMRESSIDISAACSTGQPPPTAHKTMMRGIRRATRHACDVTRVLHRTTRPGHPALPCFGRVTPRWRTHCPNAIHTWCDAASRQRRVESDHRVPQRAGWVDVQICREYKEASVRPTLSVRSVQSEVLSFETSRSVGGRALRHRARRWQSWRAQV